MRWSCFQVRQPYYLATFAFTLLTKRTEKGGYHCLVLPQLAFFDFITGAPHALSAVHAMNIPLVDNIGSIRVEVEVIGDHILASAVHD